MSAVYWTVRHNWNGHLWARDEGFYRGWDAARAVLAHGRKGCLFCSIQKRGGLTDCDMDEDESI